MYAKISTNRVPEHLVGTREGLFHVLRGTDIIPQEDPMARAELPRVVQIDKLAQRTAELRNSPVFLKSERDRMSAFLNKDEFCFAG
ncbi:hypothetical protein [Roseovarius sp. MMSF_3359]|uniref:hypothetical protein n=1 Tax=Roseovarius sp. MMSF_3359 TaxID=3046707 RepID=UPI00273EC73D|nr:hypothetical protein [Roseovarius sp. MMSF_3359]